MLKRAEKLEIIEQLSQQVYELCDEVMANIEEEMDDAELTSSVAYLACGKLADAIEESLTILSKAK